MNVLSTELLTIIVDKYNNVFCFKGLLFHFLRLGYFGILGRRAVQEAQGGIYDDGTESCQRVCIDGTEISGELTYFGQQVGSLACLHEAVVGHTAEIIRRRGLYSFLRYFALGQFSDPFPVNEADGMGMGVGTLANTFRHIIRYGAIDILHIIAAQNVALRVPSL